MSTLYWQIDLSAHLGFPDYVAWAEVDSLPSSGRVTYNGTEYFGAEFYVAAHLWEGVSAVA